MKPYKTIKRGEGNEYFNLFKKLYPIKKRNEVTTFAIDKPLVLPEFNLKDGLIRDLLESKSK